MILLLLLKNLLIRRKTMVIDKIRKINPKEPDQKNEKASDMLVGKGKMQ